MLVSQSVWWIIPYALLMVVMVFAMMAYTATLLAAAAPARHNSEPVDSDELRRRLMALDSPGNPYRLVRDKECDLELRWDPAVETKGEEPALNEAKGRRTKMVRHSSFVFHPSSAKLKFSTAYGARMLFDEEHHEVRWWEYLRSASFFLGFDGWIPRFNWSWRLQTGYINTVQAGRVCGIRPGFPRSIGEAAEYELDTVRLQKEIANIITESGWTFRPVLWWSQVERGHGRLLQAILPPGLKHISARRFWRTLYIGSFILGMAYLAVVAWPLGTSGWVLLLGISAAWWGVWGFIVWALTGFPALGAKSPDSSE